MPSSNAEPREEATAILRMAFAFVTSQVLYVAAELGLADHLADGSRSAHDLGGQIGDHGSSGVHIASSSAR